MTTESRQEIWESNDHVSFTIQESASEVDGKYILAKVQGPAFFPNTVSRNKVHYPIEAWENAIENDEFNARLRDRLVFGTIGHETDLTDNEIRDGKMSHIVTKVWIDEDDGIGKAEYLVLNTPPGQILNTLLRAGSRLRVSTKAEGFFERSNNRDGSKSVIPDKFILERIDFVSDPGYRQALPSVIESNNTPSEDFKMPQDNTEQNKIIESLVTSIREENTSLKATLNSVQESKNSIDKEFTKLQSVLENYQSFGTIAAVQESLSELDQYRALGTVHELHEALDNGEEAITSLTKSLDDTQEELNKLSSSTQNKDYEDLGEPSEVRDALDAALDVIAELKQYRELGTLEEIQAVIDRANEMTETLEVNELQNLADKYQISLETVRALCDKCETLDEAEDIIKNIKGTTQSPTVENQNTQTQVPATYESKMTENDDQDEEDEEDEEDKMAVSESMSSRLLNRSHKFVSKIRESNSKLKDKANTPLSARLMTGKR